MAYLSLPNVHLSHHIAKHICQRNCLVNEPNKPKDQERKRDSEVGIGKEIVRVHLNIVRLYMVEYAQYISLCVDYHSIYVRSNYTLLLYWLKVKWILWEVVLWLILSMEFCGNASTMYRSFDSYTEHNFVLVPWASQMPIQIVSPVFFHVCHFKYIIENVKQLLCVFLFTYLLTNFFLLGPKKMCDD